MNEIKKNLKIFVDAVKSSDVYLNYYKQKEILSANPVLLSQVNDFRAQNYALQTTKNVENLYDEIDRFEMQYAEFRRNPEVNAFLEKHNSSLISTGVRLIDILRRTEIKYEDLKERSDNSLHYGQLKISYIKPRFVHS